MSNSLAQQAGSAIFWKAFQLGGVKAIYLIRTIILARILVPDDFGLLAISLIAVDFLMSITNLGMTPALVQHTSPQERQYNVAWTIGIIRAMVISIMVFLSAPFISVLFAEPRVTDLVRVMALRPVIEAAASIKMAELTRSMNFRSLAFVYLPESLANTVVSITLASFFGVWALVIGLMAGLLIYVVMSYLIAPHKPWLIWDTSSAKPLVRFGRWIFLIGIIAVVGSSLLQLVISRKLGVTELGLYYLAAKLAFIPAEISSVVIGEVAFPLYSRLQTEARQVVRAFHAIMVSVSAVLIPICALLIVLAPSMVTNVLGPRWDGTIPLIQLLALVNIVGLFGDMTVPIFKGMGHPEKLVVIGLLQSAILISLVSTLTDQLGVMGAPLAWIVAVGSAQIVSWIFLQRMLTRPYSGLVKPLLLIFIVSCMGSWAAWGLSNAIPGLFGLIIAILLGVSVIGALLCAVDRGFSIGISQDFRLAFPHLAHIVGDIPTK
jgi:lipopolysaccharide exporter